MSDLSVLAIATAGLAAFIASGAYYAIFGEQLARFGATAATDSRMPPWKLAVEFLRTLVVAAVVAGLAAKGDWVGSDHPRDTPKGLAVIHGGDWLVKLLLIGLIVGALP